MSASTAWCLPLKSENGSSTESGGVDENRHSGRIGQVGAVLARAFHHEGHEVVVLSRRPEIRPWRVAGWDGVDLGDWQRELDGCDAVINLAGRSVNCRYTDANRREIFQSRVMSTHAVGQAIVRAGGSPECGFRRAPPRFTRIATTSPNDECTGILGGTEKSAPETWRFSIDVARAWERAFDEAVVEGTRKVALRSAITLSPDPGGVFAAILGLARAGLGGRTGDGRQFMSWIHYEDFVAAVRWLIDSNSIWGSSTSPRQTRCRMRSSCGCCVRPMAFRSVCRCAAGCWRSAPCSCARKPNWYQEP